MSFHGLIVHLCLARKNIPLSECTTVYLSMNLPKDILVASMFQQLWIKLLETSLCGSFYVDTTFQLIWVNTKEHNCWILWWDIGEGNGTPLQYSCLENPMAWGAWWAAVHGVAESRTRLSDFTFTLHFHSSLSCIGEGNSNPLQRSCLENPRDGGAWWAAIYGVTQSQTRLKWLSSSRENRTWCQHTWILLFK